MGSLGLPRVPLPWGVRDPLPWDPLGSQGFPLPWVPSHGIPLGSQGSPPMGSHPTSPSIFVRPGRILTTKELTRRLFSKVSFVDPIWQLRGLWQDRNERKHLAQLYRPQVSYVLSHQIAKSFQIHDTCAWTPNKIKGNSWA